MNENEIVNHGSKKKSLKFNNFFSTFFKEQRINDSRDFFNKNSLRYILMGCENSYPVVNPSNQKNNLNFLQYSKKYYSSIENVPKSLKSNSVNNSNTIYLDPYFITGFSDAESNFTCSIVSDSRSKLK